MACTLFTRIFHGTALSSQPRPASPRLDGFIHRRPSSLTSSRRKHSLAKLKSVLFTRMESKPPVSVLVESVPTWLNQRLIEASIKDAPALIRVRHRQHSYITFKYDLILDFKPGTDAFASLGITADEPWMIIDHVELRVTPSEEDYPLKDIKVAAKLKRLPDPPAALGDQPPRYALKFSNLDVGQGECCICRTEIDRSFSTPCWNCRKPQCYDCVKCQFSGALQDFEQFPARCCGMAFHPDVAKGILSIEEHTRYKSRFEERLTKTPVYCPVPTCSAFIPPRLARPVNDTNFDCHACQTSLCTLCKQHAHTGEACDQNDEDVDKLDLLEKFGYKQCPKCGIAVGKMYGCSHMQCSCGAHWCWHCQRRIETCNVFPCDEARVDNEYYVEALVHDEESELDSDSDTEGNKVLDHGNSSDAIMTDENSIDRQHAPCNTGETPTQQQSLEIASNNTLTPSAHITGASTGMFTTLPADPRMTHNLAIAFSSEMATALAMEQHEQPAEQSATGHGNSEAATKDVDSAAGSDSGSKGSYEESVNLDDPELGTWEFSSLNFGSEPEDDDALDLWGCIHHFEPATYNKVPRHWMTASIPDWWEREVSQREIECMNCWKAVKMAPRPSEIEVMEDGEKKRKIIKDWRFARRCTKCSIIVCRRCRNGLTKAQIDEELS